MLKLQMKVFDISTEKFVELANLSLDAPSGTFVLTPQVISASAPALEGLRLGFNASVQGDGTLMHIAGFEYFTLAAFANGVARLPTLSVHGASNFFRLNDLEIKRLDSEFSNGMVCGCVVSEFNVGIGTNHDRLHKSDSSEQAPVWTHILGGSVERFRVFVPHSKLVLQESDLHIARVEQSAKRVASLTISQECRVRDLSLSGRLQEVQLVGAAVDSLFFMADARLTSFLIRPGAVANYYGANLDTFNTPTLDSARSIVSSARNAHDPDLLAASSFLYAQLHRRQLRTASARLMGLLMEISCGFGYKPVRTSVCAVSIWMGFSTAYFLLTVLGCGGIQWHDMQADDLPSLVGRSLYFSAITLTTVGFGDVTPSGAVAMGLACIEGGLGIVLFALLVFSLSKRFGSD